MADISSENKRKKSKRKFQSPEEGKKRPFKAHRVDKPKKEKRRNEAEEEEAETSSKRYELEGNIEAGNPWSNLDLILSLQNKEIDLQRKVELAFNYVNLRAKQGGGDGGDEEDGHQTVKRSRLVGFLSEWVQSLLISGDKKVKVNGVVEACLDYRCWVVFKFCLEESSRLKVSLSLSRNLLRAISCVARRALLLLKEGSLSNGEGVGSLYGVAVECISMVFLSHGGVSNENLDLWVLAVGSVLELVNGICDEGVEGGDVGVFGLRFACLVLEPFAKFLRVHPARKNGFHDFVDKLLEPLLRLLSVLRLHLDGNNPVWKKKLLTVIEEVLSQGLFHPIHIDGFLTLHTTEKYSASNDRKVEAKRVDIRSYHRHLFDKLENVSASNKDSALSGLGDLFHLLVDRVKRQKGASLLSEEIITIDKTALLKIGDLSSLNAGKRKSLFDFFVQIMEPLLLKMDGYLQKELEVGPFFLEVHRTLKAVNILLAQFLHEKLYLKTEDNSDGACLNFLKKVYNSIFSFATHLLHLPTYDVDKCTQEILTSLAEDLLVSVGYFLDVDYEVIQSNVVGLWLMMLKYLAISHLFNRSQEGCALTLQIFKLGCQLVKLYSELRQVKVPVYALCKAIRILVVPDADSDVQLYHGGFWHHQLDISYEAYAKSVEKLLSNQDFKHVIHVGIKSIPEGQVSEFIRQLSDDLSESLEWLKHGGSIAGEGDFGVSDYKESMLGFDVQSELLGRGLSKIYAIVLDSVTVTVSNSILVGHSIGYLMSTVRPCISTLVGLHPDGVNEFLSSVMGGAFCKIAARLEHDRQPIRASAQWIFVFVFHLYMSCRSLYRQTISVMPPGTSKKMSVAMGDSITAYSGSDWMKRTDWMNEGYFSWIIQPSASLLVIIQSISEIYCQGGTAGCCTLIYLFQAMAIQRLVDLNRQINSLEYILQSNEAAFQTKLHENVDLSLQHKKSRKLRKHLSVQKQEAAGLTDFLMRQAKNCQLLAEDLNVAPLNASDEALKENGKWSLSACSLNEKSLPTAIWWILCQNIDIWSIHASKKNLKVFLSHVIWTSLPYINRSLIQVERQNTDEDALLSEISEHQISSSVLNNSILYEHKFVCRHLASRICHLLEKSVSASFHIFSPGDVTLGSSPSWQEVISTLESSSSLALRRKPIVLDKLSEGKSTGSVSFELHACIAGTTSMKYSACQQLLHFLCWMPKGYISSRSFSLYATYLLNLERIVIGILLECQNTLSSNELLELLRLLVSCRRALKHIIMAYCEKKSLKTKSLLIPILSVDPYSVLWLLKSASFVIGLQESLSEHSTDGIRDVIISLMDHTSYMFLTISKYHYGEALHSLSAQNSCKEKFSPNVVQDGCNLKESDPCLLSSKNAKSWKGISLISEVLKEQTQGLLASMRDSVGKEKVGHGASAIKLNNFSFIVSCFGGFMWGLTSALKHAFATDNDCKEKIGTWKSEPLSQINDCMSVFIEFSTYLLWMFCDKEEHRVEKLHDITKSDNSSSLLGSGELSVAISNGEQHKRHEDTPTCSVSDNCYNSWNLRDTFVIDDAKSVASVLSNIESCRSPLFNPRLLQSLHEGAHPEAAILARQLLIASSSVLRLKFLNPYTPWSSSCMPTLVGISQFLLSMLADMAEVPLFSFVWLDGALKYLQELGSHFSLTSPMLTRNAYAKLIELHLKALGRCISSQGKQATLASHENESNTKRIDSYIGSSESSHSCRPLYINEFKARLRMSLIGLIRKPSELHLLSAIQAIERAMVGVKEGCTAVYEINMQSTGGRVSSTVAASVDCLDLVLEHVSGHKRLNVVKRHIQSLIASLFNIILHLRSPLIFCSQTTASRDADAPDPGAVVLMSVEVLTRISAKHALFQMDSWHIAESLRIPAALFQEFGLLGVSEAAVSSTSSQERSCAVDVNNCAVDQQFSINIFAACCRLLYTTLKYHKSESERCIALLQESTRILLCSLEMADANFTIRKNYISLGVQGGVQCACSFRRIYEELRQQKDVFGRHCFKFLSDYIWIYSGYGPLKGGIRREIDDALKPGLYALLDVCSADDLQYLHSVHGEGPCRNTLATLQHDYKLNFQYEGKV